MKKLLLLAVTALSMVGTASASDKDGRVQIGAGLLYENGLELTVGYEKEMSHHNAWEFFGNVYLKLLLSAKHDNALPTISKRVVWSLFILDKPPLLV